MIVNLLIVGAQKSGTTALARFLGQHPDIFMSDDKELHVFDAPDYGGTDYAAARFALAFHGRDGAKWRGEATPAYMFLPGVAERVHHYNPSMRLIAILRNPVERALSHYAMERSRNVERRPLWQALAAEPFRLWRDRDNMAWGSSLRDHTYLARGFYSRQLQRLFALFPREQILVLKTEDLYRRHGDTLAAVYRFLEIAPPAVLPEPQFIRAFLGHGITDHQVTPSRAVRVALQALYRGEFARLERMLGWNLDDWRTVK